MVVNQFPSECLSQREGIGIPYALFLEQEYVQNALAVQLGFSEQHTTAIPLTNPTAALGLG